MSLSMKNRATAMNKIVQDIAAQIDWSMLPQVTEWVIDRCIAIQQIPAPTFHEADRAAYVAEQFKALGLTDIHTDEHLNVYGIMPGTHRDQPGLMIAAHTDTVFTADTDLTLTRNAEKISGPGIGDNSLGVAGMLGIAEMLRRLNIIPPCDLHFVATSREEGLGNLEGMRAAFERVQEHIAGVINIEGLALGFVYNAGIAVRRFKITAQADGGHSWVHFGRHSATHAIAQLGSRIASMETPERPRTTYNIGMINGGHAINAIATNAELWLDLRSESPAELAVLEHQVRRAVDDLSESDLRFTIEVVGDRPAGSIPRDHPLVKIALATLDAVNTHGGLHSGSTDGNIPLAADCPTVTVGVTTGGHAHRLDEYIETAPVETGMKQLILLTVAAAEQVEGF